MSMEAEETPEDRLRDMATAMEVKDETLIPPGYQTEDAAQFIADIYAVLAKVQANG
jgi:putative heme degradation protein